MLFKLWLLAAALCSLAHATILNTTITPTCWLAGAPSSLCSEMAPTVTINLGATSLLPASSSYIDLLISFPAEYTVVNTAAISTASIAGTTVAATLSVSSQNVTVRLPIPVSFPISNLSFTTITVTFSAAASMPSSVLATPGSFAISLTNNQSLVPFANSIDTISVAGPTLFPYTVESLTVTPSLVVGSSSYLILAFTYPFSAPITQITLTLGAQFTFSANPTVYHNSSANGTQIFGSGQSGGVLSITNFAPLSLTAGQHHLYISNSDLSTAFAGTFSSFSLAVNSLTYNSFSSPITIAPAAFVSTTFTLRSQLSGGSDIIPVLRLTLTNPIQLTSSLNISVPSTWFTVVATPVVTCTINGAAASVSVASISATNQITVYGFTSAVPAGASVVLKFSAFATTWSNGSAASTGTFNFSTQTSSGNLIDSGSASGYVLETPVSSTSMAFSSLWPYDSPSMTISSSLNAQYPASSNLTLTFASAFSPFPNSIPSFTISGNGCSQTVNATCSSSPIVCTLPFSSCSSGQFNVNIPANVVRNPLYSGTARVTLAVSAASNVDLTQSNIFSVSIIDPFIVSNWPFTGLPIVENSTTSRVMQFALKRAPTAAVRLCINSASTQVLLANQCVEFSVSNWNTSQSISFLPVDNLILEGQRYAALTMNYTSMDFTYSHSLSSSLHSTVLLIDNDIDAAFGLSTLLGPAIGNTAIELSYPASLGFMSPVPSIACSFYASAFSWAVTTIGTTGKATEAGHIVSCTVPALSLFAGVNASASVLAQIAASPANYLSIRIAFNGQTSLSAQAFLVYPTPTLTALNPSSIDYTLAASGKSTITVSGSNFLDASLFGLSSISPLIRFGPSVVRSGNLTRSTPSGEVLITCIAPPSRTGGVDSLTVDISFNQQQFTSSAIVLSYFDPDDVLAASEWNLFFYAAGVLGGITLLFMCGALMWRFCQLRRLQENDAAALIESQAADTTGPDSMLNRLGRHMPLSRNIDYSFNQNDDDDEDAHSSDVSDFEDEADIELGVMPQPKLKAQRPQIKQLKLVQAHVHPKLKTETLTAGAGLRPLFDVHNRVMSGPGRAKSSKS